MGSDEVYYVSRISGLTAEEVIGLEPDVFHWLLESCIEQDMEEAFDSEIDKENYICL